MFDIYATPIVPRPRDPNIKPPVQQKAAPKAVKIDSMLRIFSFIKQTSRGYNYTIFYQFF